MDYKDYKAGKSESNFWFRAKRDLIDRRLKFIKNKFKSDTKLKILNIGAGTGSDLKILNKYGDVYIIDIEKKALDLIPRELYFEKKISDASDLNYPDDFFDIVTSFDVFEHITDDKKATQQTHRVLKKGGYLIVSVPAFQSLFSAHDKALNHQRRYSKKTLKELLKNFRELKLNYWNFFLFPPLALSRLKNKNSKPKVDNPQPSKLIDSILYNLFKLENKLIQINFPLPFGLTLIGNCRK